METYWALLQKWSRRISLTTVASFGELMEFHFFESFLGLRLLKEGERKLADIGSGAGFPGLGLQVLDPALEVSLLERHHRKAVFLKEAVRRLGLGGEVHHLPAEDFVWTNVDAATARALKTSARVEAALGGGKIPLLAFHGQDVPVSGAVKWRAETRLAVPGSHRRMISRLIFFP